MSKIPLYLWDKETAATGNFMVLACIPMVFALPAIVTMAVLVNNQRTLELLQRLTNGKGRD